MKSGGVQRSLRKNTNVISQVLSQHETTEHDSHRRVSLVDHLSHEVGVEHSLGDDGEPGDQVTHAQSEELSGHL